MRKVGINLSRRIERLYPSSRRPRNRAGDRPRPCGRGTRAPRAPAEGTEEERGWAELICEGVITPAKRPLGGPPESLNIMTFEELMAQIAADREDR